MNTRIYNEYVKLFTREKATAAKFGLPFDWDKMFTKKQLEDRIEPYKNTNPNMSTKQIVKAIVDEQRFYHSEAQGRAIQKGAALRGYKITLKEARSWSGESDDETAPHQVRAFWNEVRTRRAQLKAQGKTSSEVATLIAIEFFGSPE